MATVAGAIFITWILNRFFLERYYTASKVDTLASAYTTVENILSKYYVKKNEESADAGLFLFDGAVSLTSYKSSDSSDPEVPDSITDPDGSIFSPSGMFEYKIGLREITSDNFLTAEDTLALEKLASINNLSIYVLVDYRYYFSTMSTYTREGVLYQKIKSYLDGMNEHSELIEQVVYDCLDEGAARVEVGPPAGREDHDRPRLRNDGTQILERSAIVLYLMRLQVTLEACGHAVPRCDDPVDVEKNCLHGRASARLS